ncbi:MAG: response regulator [Planctomycetota bacterium]|nr:MAG: response regulator [Planctomycetota bacterium]
MEIPEALHNKRILIVDDFKELRELFSDILSFSGFITSMAASGEEAIKLFFENPFDLVIVDLFMPGMSGLEVISTLIKDYPDVKIIAISGGGDDHFDELDEFLLKADYKGAKKSLQKPCSPEVLLKSVVEVLSDSNG